MPMQTELKLGVADHGLPLSVDEFAAAVFEEPWRYELVNGKLVVMSPTGDEHAVLQEEFLVPLAVYKASHPNRIDRVFTDAWISIDGSKQRIADLAVYLKGPRPRKRLPVAIPDLVFEIVSGGGEDRKRDYVDKRAEYLRIGVKEYVIVDRFQSRLTVLRRVRGRFVESHLGAGDVYTSSLLPGLKIPLNGIL
jgi:Uma2 family endonuclease